MQTQLKSPKLIHPDALDTFLPPIEKPKGLMMKLVYAMTRRQFGKVLTPLKVFCARMPLTFGQFYGKISALDKKLHLPPETAMLIREQVARTNVCLFCVDIGRWFTIKVSMNEAKFNALDQYRSSYLFSDAERAALDYVTDLTKD
jgi:alkylhydroperoxidase family enzyme